MNVAVLLVAWHLRPLCRPSWTASRQNLKDLALVNNVNVADFFQSTWWKYCTESAAEIFGDPTSVEGKTFRRCFRVPWTVIWEIYQEALHMNWFPQHNPGK